MDQAAVEGRGDVSWLKWPPPIGTLSVEDDVAVEGTPRDVVGAAAHVETVTPEVAGLGRRPKGGEAGGVGRPNQGARMSKDGSGATQAGEVAATAPGRRRSRDLLSGRGPKPARRKKKHAARVRMPRLRRWCKPIGIEDSGRRSVGPFEGPALGSSGAADVAVADSRGPAIATAMRAVCEGGIAARKG